MQRPRLIQSLRARRDQAAIRAAQPISKKDVPRDQAELPPVPDPTRIESGDQPTPTAQEATVTDQHNDVMSPEYSLRDWFTYKVNKLRSRFETGDKSDEQSDRKSERMVFLAVVTLLVIAFSLILVTVQTNHQTQEDEALDTGIAIGYADGLQDGASQERNRLQLEDANLPAGADNPFDTDEVATVVFSTICSVETDSGGFWLELSSNREVYVSNDMVMDLDYGNPVDYMYIQELWNADGTLMGISYVSGATDQQGYNICVSRNDREIYGPTGYPRG